MGYTPKSQRGNGLGLNPYEMSNEAIKLLIEKASVHEMRPVVGIQFATPKELEIEKFIIFLKAILESRK